MKMTNDDNALLQKVNRHRGLLAGAAPSKDLMNDSINQRAPMANDISDLVSKIEF